MRFISYDTETSGLERHRGAGMFAFSTCDWDGETDIRRLDGKPGRVRASERELDKLWGERGKKQFAKIMFNTRFDVGITEKRLGRSLRGHEVHEVMALHHIFDNAKQSRALGDVAWRLAGYPKDDEAQVKKYATDARGYLDVPEWLLKIHQHRDAQRTMLLFRHWYPKLKENGWQEIYEMERALVWTTLSIEDRGVMVSKSRAKKLVNWLLADKRKALAEFREATGKRVSMTPADVRYILHKQLKLPVLQKTKTGLACVNKEVLNELKEKTEHPIFDLIFRHRSRARGASIIAGYLDLMDDDCIIHPSINPFEASTSRESCSRPNLQNVERDDRMMNPYPTPARKAFRPKPGFVNFHLDYEGQELRGLVHFSGDEEFAACIRRGDDPHELAMVTMFPERSAGLTGAARKQFRDANKNANFGIGFCGGVKVIVRTTGVSESEAAVAYKRYKNRFPGFTSLGARTTAEVRKTRCVYTIFNRRLFVPCNKPYAGVNYEVQGSAAGIIKRAQIRVDDYLRSATGGEAGINMVIHDELIIEWPRKRLREAPGCLREIVALMIDFPQMSVPLDVSVKVSTRDWATKTPFDIGAN